MSSLNESVFLKQKTPIISKEEYEYGLSSTRTKFNDFFINIIGIIYILYINKKDDLIYNFIYHINNILSYGKIPIYGKESGIIASIKYPSYYLHPFNESINNQNTFQTCQSILNVITDGNLFLVDTTTNIKSIQLRVINKKYYEEIYSISGNARDKYYNKIIF